MAVVTCWVLKAGLEVVDSGHIISWILMDERHHL